MKKTLTNLDLANCITKILEEQNIKNINICPGSRNTPLKYSILNNNYFKCLSFIDERVGSFFTLGISKSIMQPSVIITTSGTAVANLLPAIIEADLSMIPLIIITADRPKQLQYKGENQTIRQYDIFKNYTRTTLNIDNTSFADSHSLLSKIHTTINKANGLKGILAPGPIHINVAFDEPLLDDSTINNFNFKYEPNKQITENTLKIKNYKKPIIVCGQLNDRTYADMIINLSEKLMCPIFADPLSQMRFNIKHHNILSSYDFYIDHLNNEPDYVIRFGKKITSKKLNTYLNTLKCDKILITDAGGYNDDIKSLYIKDFNINNLTEESWLDSYITLENNTQEILNKYLDKNSFFEGNIINHCFNNFKNNDQLFIGNSLPVRMLEKYTQNTNKDVKVYANRGASGIDGIIASALGMSYNSQLSRNILIIGDISFFYDINALLVGKQYNLNLSIIIINNNGGQIFKTLPQFDESLKNIEEFWTTPINLNIEQCSKLYSCNYFLLNSIKHINEQLNLILDTKGINLIEITCNIEDTLNIENKINKEIHPQT